MARCKAEATYRIPRTLSRNSSSNSVIEVRTVGIERGVHHLDQIALDGRGLVLGGGECHYDLERIFGCAASSTLEAGSASTRGWASTMARTFSSAGSNSVPSAIGKRTSVHELRTFLAIQRHDDLTIRRQLSPDNEIAGRSECGMCEKQEFRCAGKTGKE